VLRDFPGTVKAATLDSVAPPSVDVYAAAGVNAQRSFELIFAACAAQPNCEAAYPDLRGRFYAALADIESMPRIGTARDGTPVRFDQGRAMSLLFLLAYSAEAIAYLPEIIYRLHERRLDELATLAVELERAIDSIAFGMHYSVMCSDVVPFSSAEAVAAASAELEPAFRNVFGTSTAFEICRAWNVPPSPDLENTPITSDVSSLVLAGEFDPVTPPAWSSLAASTLPNSFYFEVPGAAHAAFSDGCGATLLGSFVDDPVSPPNGGCANARTPLKFELVRAAGAGGLGRVHVDLSVLLDGHVLARSVLSARLR